TLANYRLYSTSETLEEVVCKDINKATDKATNEIIDEAIDNKATNKATNEITVKAIDTKAFLQGLQDINFEEILFTTEQSKQDSISYSLVFDTDFLDNESGNALLKVTLGQTFSTWEASVNENLSKNTSIIIFITVIDEHNHYIVPSPSTNIATYCRLGEDMVEFIESCVHYSITSTQSIGHLLKGKFLGRIVYQKGLYNAIQVAKKKLVIRVEFNASDFIKHLYSQHAKDQTWLVATVLLKDETENSFVWALKNLKAQYVSANNYIKQQLDSLKHKWAICYTNSQFTASANSTQWVESLNRKIHNCVYSNSSLLFLVKEIQKLLDKESEYVRVEEYKEQIPTISFLTVSKTYFGLIEKVVSYYLLPVIVFTVCRQMQECFYYDSFQIDNTIIGSMIQEQISIDYSEKVREDNYKVTKIHLTNIILAINYDQILEEVNSTRQKYGRARGLMRKALDLAIATNAYIELMGICHEFILDKQEPDAEMNNIEFDIMNSIITAQRE
ncbi:35726_t:CDS:2, partial [Gigaspora margarita]